MVELVQMLMTADLADVETLLGDLYAPTCAGIIFVGAILPPCGMISAVLALIHALGGGGSRA